jgi:carotenoid cleavage dioxygenase-like enzyme
MVHDAELPECKAELVVLDAARITAGPVARIRLPHHVPYSTAVGMDRGEN